MQQRLLKEKNILVTVLSHKELILYEESINYTYNNDWRSGNRNFTLYWLCLYCIVPTA